MFSPREEKIIKAVGQKKVSVEEICKEVFKDEDSTPFEPRISITNSISRIISKCEYRNLEWTLEKKLVNNKLIISKGKR